MADRVGAAGRLLRLGRCASLIVLGTFGVVAAIRDRTLAEIIVLRAEALTFLVVSAAAVVLLIDDGFQQWRG